MSDYIPIGYIQVDSDKVISACDDYLEWVDQRYTEAKNKYIESIIKTKHGFLWNKRFYTCEEAEHMWMHGTDDYLYTPHELQTFKGAITIEQVKELRILALNSDKVIVSNNMSFLFS